jgi:hypothetical protein
MVSPSEFERCLALVLALEGGASNHPQDPGGYTDLGISLAAVQHRQLPDGTLEFDLDHDGDVDQLDLKLMRQAWDEGDQVLVKRFYRDEYWLKAGCDKFPWPINLLVFDAAVNHGPVSAVILLQQVLGVKTDGIVGPQTIASATLAATSPSSLISVYFGKRGLLYFRISVSQVWRQLVADRYRLEGPELASLRATLLSPPFMEGWQARLAKLQNRIGTSL